MSATDVDAGHLLPDEDWAVVVAVAAVEAERIAAGRPAPEAPAAGRYGTGALAVSGQVYAPRNGGRRKRGGPTFGVLHSAETPLRAGFAASIARMFATTEVDKSCHYMTDPAETWGVLPDELVAWHCGTGSTNSLALEQAGYARMSRAEWTTPDGMAQLHRNAAVIRAARDRFGIGAYWMTDQQLRDAHAGRIVGGWATHDQCRRVLGGTSHTDPGTGYPYDLLMSIANGEEMAFSWTDATKAQRDAFLIDLRESVIRPMFAEYFGVPYDAVTHHGGDGDTPIGHAISGHKYARATYDLLTTGSDRGAGALFPALFGDPAAIAAALAPAILQGIPDGALDQADVERAVRNVLGSLA